MAEAAEDRPDTEDKAEENAEEKAEEKAADDEKNPALETPKGTGDKPQPLQFASLYVGDLHPDVAEATLYEAFQSAGNVASCRVCRDSVSRKSLGYGYVNYYTVEDAEKALDTLNYMSIKGKACRIMWSQRDQSFRKHTNSNIFVKGLDPTIDNKALHDTFGVFGHILSCKVSCDPGGKSRGYGFVHYESERAAQEAITRVNGMKIGDSIVFVGPFKQREEGEKDPEETYTNLYVKNMPQDWDDAKVMEVFGEFGKVQSSVCMRTEDGKTFALVNFSESSAAKAAVAALHRKDMRGDGAPTSEEGGKEGGAEEVKEEADDEAKAEAQAEAKAEAKEDQEEDEKAAGKGQAEEGARDAAAESGQTSEGDADKAATGEAAKGGAKSKKSKREDDHPDHLLYVQRAQTREERKKLLEEQKAKKGAGKGGKSQGVRLCVRNLSESATDDTLRELFEPHGKVLHAVVRLDEETGLCKGVGFVVLSSTDEVTKAIAETHLRMVDGKPLNVGLAERRAREEKGGRGDRGDRGDRGEGAGKGQGAGKGEHAGKGRDKGKGKGRSGRGQAGPGAPLMGAPPGPAISPLPPYPGMPGGVPYGALPGYPVGYALPGRPPVPPNMFARPPMVGAYSLPPAVAAGCTAMSAGAFGVAPGYAATMPGGAPAPGAAGALGLYGQTPAGAQQAVLPPVIPSLQGPLSPMYPHLQAQKQQLGERLFGLSFRYRPDLAGKVTGMMLELDNNEILGLLNDEAQLRRKIDEAVGVLQKQYGNVPAPGAMPPAK